MLEFNDQNWQAEVLDSEQPVLVDFWASWCGPCRQLTPIFESVAQKFEKQVKFGKCSIDDSFETAKKYKVSSIPLMLLFKNGKVVNRLVGLHSEEEVANMVKE